MADEPTTTTTEQPETTDATAAGAGQQPGQETAPVTFTQKQLDAILKERLAQAKRSTTADVLKDLGVEDAETAKKTLADAAKVKEAQMSELEKAQAQIVEAQAAAAQATTDAAAIKAKAAEAMLKAAIVSQAGEFNDPMDAWQFIDRSTVEVQEDGTYKGIDEALKALAEAKPYLIKATNAQGPGTPARAKQKTITEKLLEGKQKAEAAGERRSTVRM